MANPKWRIRGQYMETCNCTYLCPCIYTNMTALPTHGDCKVAMAFRIDEGDFDGTTLDGLAFIAVARAPTAMGAGGWQCGVIIDARATPAQRDAIAQIASGQAGGPMAAMAPLIGQFMGLEYAPIEFIADGMVHTVRVTGRIDQTATGVARFGDPSAPIYLDNTAHPANPRLALARATASHIHAFGIDWDATDGATNGHYAPFSWAA